MNHQFLREWVRRGRRTKGQMLPTNFHKVSVVLSLSVGSFDICAFLERNFVGTDSKILSTVAYN